MRSRLRTGGRARNRRAVARRVGAGARSRRQWPDPGSHSGRSAKPVRKIAKTGSRFPPSLADLAADRMLLHLADRPSSIALIGVSPMTKRCGELLHQAGVPVMVVNRSQDTGEEFAQTINGTAVSLAEFRARPRDVAGL